MSPGIPGDKTPQALQFRGAPGLHPRPKTSASPVCTLHGARRIRRPPQLCGGAAGDGTTGSSMDARETRTGRRPGAAARAAAGSRRPLPLYPRSLLDGTKLSDRSRQSRSRSGHRAPGPPGPPGPGTAGWRPPLRGTSGRRPGRAAAAAVLRAVLRAAAGLRAPGVPALAEAAHQPLRRRPPAASRSSPLAALLPAAAGRRRGRASSCPRVQRRRLGGEQRGPRPARTHREGPCNGPPSGTAAGLPGPGRRAGPRRVLKHPHQRGRSGGPAPSVRPSPAPGRRPPAAVCGQAGPRFAVTLRPGASTCVPERHRPGRLRRTLGSPSRHCRHCGPATGAPPRVRPRGSATPPVRARDRVRCECLSRGRRPSGFRPGAAGRRRGGSLTASPRGAGGPARLASRRPGPRGPVPGASHRLLGRPPAGAPGRARGRSQLDHFLPLPPGPGPRGLPEFPPVLSGPKAGVRSPPRLCS